MRLMAEAGTDVAALALFDPEVLPEDFDERYGMDPGDLLEDLDEAGRLFFRQTGADGSYLLHLYLDEPLPDWLPEFCQDPILYERFPAPSGNLWFSGAEYVFRQDDSRLQKHPHMGERLEIPAGTYQVRILRAEYPEDFIEDRVREALGPDADQGQVWPGIFIGVNLLLTLAAAVALFTSNFALWSLGVTAVAALGWVGLRQYLSSEHFRNLQAKSDEVQRNYPSIVAEFKSIPKPLAASGDENADGGYDS